MKVYVIKRDDGYYMTETRDFINSIWQAELFDDLELACCYTPHDCNVVECALMTPTEFQDYTKQVRKEAFEELYKWCEQQHFSKYSIDEFLDQIQGESDGKQS